MTAYERRINDFRTTILSMQNQSTQSSKLRFISPEKWKNLMLHSLDAVSEFSYADKDLIHDLRLIITNISQDKIVQAILSFQPFKPKFKSSKFLNQDYSNCKLISTASGSQCLFNTPKTKLKRDESILQKGSIIINKRSSVRKQPKTCETIKQVARSQKQSFLKEYIEVIIQEEALKKQFQKKYHPFKKIIDSFVFILENKYKNLIDSKSKMGLQKIQQLISYDILIVEKLFVKISDPYYGIYQSQNPQQVRCFKQKMQVFMKDYVNKHEKINASVRKLMRHYARKSKAILRIQQNIPDFAEIGNFNISSEFKIDGCYVQSMNSLMQFAQTFDSAQSLQKLKEFRAAIAKDVDCYYQSLGQQQQREINAQVQIQIVRFVLCKLKGWVPQIYAQLKFLQIIYGDEEIAYKYDDSSYIYAQLITVFDSLQIQSSSELSFSESALKQSKII